MINKTDLDLRKNPFRSLDLQKGWEICPEANLGCELATLYNEFDTKCSADYVICPIHQNNQIMRFTN